MIPQAMETSRFAGTHSGIKRWSKSSAKRCSAPTPSKIKLHNNRNRKSLRSGVSHCENRSIIVDAIAAIDDTKSSGTIGGAAGGETG